MVVAAAVLCGACSGSKAPPEQARPPHHDAGPEANVPEGGNPVDAPATPRRTPDVVADFLKAWGTADEGGRKALLAASFASDGVYTDPAQSVTGSDALSQAIAKLQQSMPGATLSATTNVDAFQGAYRVGWRLARGDGSTVQEGEDEGEVGSDGRLLRVTGFLDPPAMGASPAGLAALLRALNANSNDTLPSELQAAVTSDVVWTSSGARTSGVPALTSYLVMLVSPGFGVEFTLDGTLDSYSGFFRTSV